MRMDPRSDRRCGEVPCFDLRPESFDFEHNRHVFARTDVCEGPMIVTLVEGEYVDPGLEEALAGVPAENHRRDDHVTKAAAGIRSR
jgi:hypothetical protein